MIAQGLGIPLHLGALPDAMAALLADYGAAINEGDVFIFNDPDAGRMHLPDVFVIKPVFCDGDLVGYAAWSPTTPRLAAGWLAETPWTLRRSSRRACRFRRSNCTIADASTGR